MGYFQQLCNKLPEGSDIGVLFTNLSDSAPYSTTSVESFDPWPIEVGGEAITIPTVKATAITYNWLFQWDYTFYKWGFVSTYNWYFGP